MGEAQRASEFAKAPEDTRQSRFQHRERGAMPRSMTHPSDLLFLQRVAGNAAVSGLIGRAREDRGGAAAAIGPERERRRSRVGLSGGRAARSMLQRSPGNGTGVAEEEADRSGASGPAFTPIVHLSVPVEEEMGPGEFLVEFAVHYQGNDIVTRKQAREAIAAGEVYWVKDGKRIDLDEGPSVTAADVRKKYKLVTVYAVGVAPVSVQHLGSLRRDFYGLDSRSQAEINRQTNELFWELTGYKVGKKLDPERNRDDRLMAKDWLKLRAVMVESRRQFQHESAIDQRRMVYELMPPEARDLLFRPGGEGTLEPKDYVVALRVAGKIADLSADERAAYLSRVTAETTDWDAFERSVDAFLAIKREAPKKLGKALEKASTGEWDVDTETSALDESTMFYLSLADRVRLIEAIAGGYVVGNEDERTIIRLLTSTPPSDLAGLMGALKADGSALLKRLEKVIDGEENKLLYAALRNIVFQSLDPTETLAKMKRARVLPWASPGVIKAATNVRFHYETVEYTSDGKIRVVYWVNLAFAGIKQPEQLFEADEIVAVHFFADETLAGAVEGQTVFMPAANLLAFKNEQFSQELGLVVDVGLLFAGGAGLLAKGTRLAKAIAVLDTALAAADIVIDSFRSDIAKSEAGKRFLGAWDTVNTLIGIYGVTRIVVKLPETFRNLSRAYREFKASVGEAGPSNIPPADLKKIDAEVGKVLDTADEAGAGGRRLRLMHGTDQGGLVGTGATGGGRINVKQSSGRTDDFGQGFYLTVDQPTAEVYARVRSVQDAKRQYPTAKGGGMQHVLSFEVDVDDLGKFVDIRKGGQFHRQWQEFLDEPIHPGVPITRRDVYSGIEERGVEFERFLKRIGMEDADTIIGPVGDEIFTGITAGYETTQVCIRSQRVADRLNTMIRGEAP